MLRIIRALWLHRLSFASIPNDTTFWRLAPYWQIGTQRGEVHTLKVSLHCPPDWVITQNTHLLGGAITLHTSKPCNAYVTLMVSRPQK